VKNNNKYSVVRIADFPQSRNNNFNKSHSTPEIIKDTNKARYPAFTLTWVIFNPSRATTKYAENKNGWKGFFILV
jgi:hypothetical protein